MKMREHELNEWRGALVTARMAPITGMVPLKSSTLLAAEAMIERAWAERDAAVAAERERCAKLCDAIHARHIAEHGDYIGETYAAECARAIRAERSS